MNVLPPLGNVRRNLLPRIDEMRKSRFFRDRLSLSLLVGSLLVCALNLVLLVIHVRWSSVAPVGYSSFQVGYVLGAWYYPYLIMVYSLLTVIINAVLAYMLFNRSRLASFFLLTGGGVVAIFCLIISNALAQAAR